MSLTEPAHGRRQDPRGLEDRIRTLEVQVRILTAALDAASRLRVSNALSTDDDVRVVGGKKVRRILERGGLVSGYPELPGTD